MRSIIVKRLFIATILVAQLMPNLAISQNLFTLDNYRIPLNQKSAIIGKVHRPSNNIEKSAKVNYSIIIDTANIFRINNNGEIMLRRGVLLTPGEPFRYSVTISIKEKRGDKRVEIKEIELVKDEFLKNMVVAHRGAWKESIAPQNSILALKNAMKIGCSWSEFDLWMSADGVPVCNHDPSIKGLMVESSPASLLTSLELAPGEYLPTVEQYIKCAMEQNKTGLVVEIKPSGISPERTLELTDKVVKMIHDLKAQAWVSYISFSYECLERVLELDPLAKTAYLGSNKSVEDISSSGMWGVDFNISLFKKDPLLVSKAKERGLTVNVWTVNLKEDLNMMIDMGADFITTNEPELLFKILKERENK